MIIYIESLEQLRKYKSFIDFLFNQYGQIYTQNYFSLEAEFRSRKNNEFVVIIDRENSLLTAFSKEAGKLECVIQGYPILSLEIIDERVMKRFLREVRDFLEVELVYFPLIYKQSSLFQIIQGVTGVMVWTRLPSPIITGDFSEEVIWKRVVERFGSRAIRQRKKFEKNLQVRSINNYEVPGIIRDIELNSWKGKCRQDMLSRDQFNYYVHLIWSGVANISVAFNREEAVAYCIDAVVKGTLYVIKWSYKESYKTFSPGFYLLTVNLFQKYAGEKLNLIDLYGSPDHLKKLLETDRLERVDICCSDLQQSSLKLKEKRLRFDQKILSNFQAQKSIKAAYINQ